MQIYSGSLTLAIAATFVSVDIDPPERAGYINEITRLEMFADEAAVAGDTIFAAAAKVPSRATMNETEAFDPDILVRGLPGINILVAASPQDNIVNHTYMLLDDDAYFQDSVRLLLATRDGAGLAAAQTIFYRLILEERKLTDSIRNRINQRAYS